VDYSFHTFVSDSTSRIRLEIPQWILVIVFPAVRACDADFLSTKIMHGQRFVSVPMYTFMLLCLGPVWEGIKSCTFFLF
jgi:hypothetical protein